ncbi:MAG TPA: PA4642 family protein [Fluviicoccus sp.]|nr:PA4642 family protein [Fluviicoccus sp.]
MALSQPARFGEDWNDDRVRGYLNRQAPTGVDPDFHVLNTAYKHMRAYDFERFMAFFLDEGRNVNAVNENGRCLLDLVREHPISVDFVHILEDAVQKAGK